MILVIGGRCQGKKAFVEKFLLPSLEESVVSGPSAAFGPSAASGQSGPSGMPGPPVIWTHGAGADWGSFMDGMYCDDLHLFIRRLMLGESVCGEGRGADGIRGMADALMKANPDRILVTDEIGYGIVPVDPFERQYRETAGRICCQAAGYASQVWRVCCGIGQRIK